MRTSIEQAPSGICHYDGNQPSGLFRPAKDLSHGVSMVARSGLRLGLKKSMSSATFSQGSRFTAGFCQGISGVLRDHRRADRRCSGFLRGEFAGGVPIMKTAVCGCFTAPDPPRAYLRNHLALFLVRSQAFVLSGTLLRQNLLSENRKEWAVATCKLPVPSRSQVSP